VLDDKKGVHRMVDGVAPLLRESPFVVHCMNQSLYSLV
jgi:hypothetical protein